MLLFNLTHDQCVLVSHLAIAAILPLNVRTKLGTSELKCDSFAHGLMVWRCFYHCIGIILLVSIISYPSIDVCLLILIYRGPHGCETDIVYKVRDEAEAGPRIRRRVALSTEVRFRRFD